jgi:hypothetical protein
LLPTDPGRWSSADGKKWGEFDSVAPQMKEDWEILSPWSILGNHEDAEGWNYAG